MQNGMTSLFFRKGETASAQDEDEGAEEKRNQGIFEPRYPCFFGFFDSWFGFPHSPVIPCASTSWRATPKLGNLI